MPPKAKFTREEVVQKAFEIVREKGSDALTARSLGDRLGSSPRPIFTVFKSMEEVYDEVVKSAKALYAQYVERGLSAEIPFKGVGTQYILFSINEPKLFILLFMSEHGGTGVSQILSVIEESYVQILSTVQKSYGLDEQNAKRLYRHLWIYTHGIATLCATGTCAFTGDEISAMLTDVCTSVIKQIKSEKL